MHMGVWRSDGTNEGHSAADKRTLGSKKLKPGGDGVGLHMCLNPPSPQTSGPIDNQLTNKKPRNLELPNMDSRGSAFLVFSLLWFYLQPQPHHDAFRAACKA